MNLHTFGVQVALCRVSLLVHDIWPRLCGSVGPQGRVAGRIVSGGGGCLPKEARAPKQKKAYRRSQEFLIGPPNGPW